MNRSLRLSTLFVLLAAAACGGSDREDSPNVDTPKATDQGGNGAAGTGSGAPGHTAPGKDGGSASAAPGADGGPSGTTSLPTIDVHGTVATYGDVLIAGRTTRVVDANGKRTDVVTDAAGGFAAYGVATPYDVRVSPEGLTDEPTVYLGIHDAAPYLRAYMATSQPMWSTQTFNVGALVVGCADCEVAFVTKSPHGSGGVTTVAPAGSITVSATLDHQFVSDGSPSEPVMLHILAHDAAGSWFGYAEASLTAVAGQTSSGGFHGVGPVPVHPFTLATQSAGVPANWRPELDILMTFADGASAAVFQGSGASAVTTNVPDIAGATLLAYSTLVDPITVTNRTIGHDVAAWSGTLSIATPSVVLSTTALLHDVVPAPGATISLKGPGISWTAAPATVTEVALYDVTPSRVLALIYTDGSSVTWEKLDMLGVAVAPGDHALSLVGVADHDLASVVTGTAAARKNLFDRSVPGSGSDQQWTFTLTP